jgi:hypothetical protein
MFLDFTGTTSSFTDYNAVVDRTIILTFYFVQVFSHLLNASEMALIECGWCGLIGSLNSKE